MKNDAIIKILEQREEKQLENLLQMFSRIVLFAAVFGIGAFGGFSEADGVRYALLFAAGMAIACISISLFLDYVFKIK